MSAVIFDVEGGWVYSVDANRYLYRTRTDGSKHIRLVDKSGVCQGISVDGEWIYYIASDIGGTGMHLYRMRTDGTQDTKLTQETSRYSIDYDDGWIYYMDIEGKGLYRQSFDGSQKHKLADCNDGYYVKVIGGFIYYIDGGGDKGLYKVKTDGKWRVKINDDTPPPEYFDIWDNWLLYMGDDYLGMIRVNDSEKTDALIEDILADTLPGVEIRRYE